MISFADSSNLVTINSELHFFRDDFATGQFEAAPGFVDYIRVYDTALTAAEVNGLGTVPEPASWVNANSRLRPRRRRHAPPRTGTRC